MRFDRAIAVDQRREVVFRALRRNRLRAAAG